MQRLKNYFIFLFLSILIASAVYSTTINPLSKGYADTLYCRIGGTCVINSMIVENLTVIGEYFNITVINANVSNNWEAFKFISRSSLYCNTTHCFSLTEFLDKNINDTHVQLAYLTVTGDIHTVNTVRAAGFADEAGNFGIDTTGIIWVLDREIETDGTYQDDNEKSCYGNDNDACEWFDDTYYVLDGNDGGGAGGHVIIGDGGDDDLSCRYFYPDEISLDDNEYIYLGNANDANIYYNGADLVINPDVVGGGDVLIDGGLQIIDNDYLILGSNDEFICWMTASNDAYCRNQYSNEDYIIQMNDGGTVKQFLIFDSSEATIEMGTNAVPINLTVHGDINSSKSIKAREGNITGDWEVQGYSCGNIFFKNYYTGYAATETGHEAAVQMNLIIPSGYNVTCYDTIIKQTSAASTCKTDPGSVWMVGSYKVDCI